MSAIFFTGIENLKLVTTPGRGELVGDVLFITSDSSYLERLIPEASRPLMGSIEFKSLVSGRPVAYTKLPDQGFASEADALRDLSNWIWLVTTFLQHIWFVKDNAAGLEFGYVVWTTNRTVMITRNFLGIVTTDAAFRTGTQHLTLDEFRRVRKLFESNVTEPALKGVKRERATRLERSSYFVHAARVSSHVPVKIANYCTALESLFSNDTSELTHKLSERVSWFVGSDAGDRLDVFQRIKRAYGIRSKVVHGAADWGSDVNLQLETSQFLDGVLRKAFDIIISRRTVADLFNGSSESARQKHDKFLLDLTLGEPSAQAVLAGP